MSAVGLLSALEALDVSSLSQAQTSLALADVARLRSWCDGLQIALTRRLAEFTPLVEHALSEVTRGGRRDADVTVRRAAVVEAVPVLGEALSAGSITAGHIDVIGRALNQLASDRRSELAGQAEELLVQASRQSPEQFPRTVQAEVARLDDTAGIDHFERQRRATSLRMWVDHSGMHRVTGQFDPENGLLLSGRLHNAVEALFHSTTPDTCPAGDGKNDHLRALALLALTGGRAEETDIVHVGRNVELAVVVDYDTLINGLHERSLLDCGDGTELPVATVRRLACTAGIIPVVFNGDGVPLDVGRSRRLATHAQRVALRAVYSHCPIAGCSVDFKYCQPHHLDPWEAGGLTDLGVLIPLCSRHHHAAHEGGWQITMHPDRSLTIVLPNGETLTTGPPRQHQRDGP